jgi:hypothetical protein
MLIFAIPRLTAPALPQHTLSSIGVREARWLSDISFGQTRIGLARRTRIRRQEYAGETKRQCLQPRKSGSTFPR